MQGKYFSDIQSDTMHVEITYVNNLSILAKKIIPGDEEEM